MGVAKKYLTAVAIGLLAGLTGCSVGPSAPTHRLLSHRALIDFTGLKPVESFQSLRVTAAPPVGWQRLRTKKSALYTHEQWRSPSGQTGVGAVHLSLPIPLSTSAVAWLAKLEYGKKASDGKILAEWTDVLGRYWFDAENKNYHVRGYVTTRGNQAWIIYCGYRLTQPPDPAEISLAMRSAETFVPLSTATPTSPATQPAVAAR